jgi:hypothetical protein
MIRIARLALAALPALLAASPAAAFDSQRDAFMRLCAEQPENQATDCDCLVGKLQEQLGDEDTEKMMLVAVRMDEFRNAMTDAQSSDPEQAMLQATQAWDRLKAELGTDDAGINALMERFGALQVESLDECAQ